MGAVDIRRPLSGAGRTALAQYVTLQASIKALQAQLDEVRAELEAQLGPAPTLEARVIGTVEGGLPVVKWSAVERESVGVAALREAAPDIAEQLVKRTTFQRLTVV